MPIPILMPALSPTMEEGTLAKWLVKEGDTVAAGDVIAEIETDKATMEVEAVDEGTMGKILVAEGTEGVPVNEPIALLLEEGEDKSALEGFDAGASKPSAPSQEKAEPQKAAQQPQAAPQPSASGQAPAPAQKFPGGSGVAQSSQPPAATGTDGRVFASPLARRMAEQAQIDLSAIEGSGPHGRIVKRDIDAVMQGGAGRPSADVIPMRPGGAPAGPMAQAQGTTEVPLTGMRKTIAKRLTEAKRDVPHYYLNIDCELDQLLRVRKSLNERSPEGEGAYKISVNDFVIRASAMALLRVPEVNSSWAEDRIIQHGSADVGMAVAIEGGLITPIIWQAEQKGLAQIAREAKDLATRARTKKLKPEEYQGGSFSISNLGMFDIKHFTAVINPPHAAILAVGAGGQRPVVKNGELGVATVMTCTLSCDHRVIDGAVGATFLQHFKAFIEEPATMLL